MDTGDYDVTVKNKHIRAHVAKCTELTNTVQSEKSKRNK